jgi:indolepyruvate ferredoxin oxidoreductase
MSDKSGSARIILSGVEALVRLLVLRHELDQRDGLTTGTMVSGYPGSPLGGFDLILENQKAALEELLIRHQPGVNEELAAATVWGSQMGKAVAYRGVDGVAGVWYGKTPGLDRSGDVLRHANAMGAGPNGGYVLFCADDPTAKSSTFACESQYTFEDACIPVFYPGDQQEVIDLGIHAFRMSRFAGPMVGMKIVTTVADGTGSIDLDARRFPPSVLPEVVIDGEPWKHEPLGTIGPHQVPNQELLVVQNRLEAAKAYVRANGLDRVVGATPGARIGLICAGKTYYDMVQAFADLGIAPCDLTDRGIRILKLAMTWPIVDATVLEFAGSVDELLVLEEKRPFVETQLRAILHEAGVITRVLGKRDRDGKPLVSNVGELNSDAVVGVLTRVLPDLAERRAEPIKSRPMALAIPPRPPSFCSGCPHNRSTVVPEGGLAGGGVGCHGIFYFEARQRGIHKMPPPPMGAEGVPWIGLSPWVSEPHLIQNLGDGTLSHSGSLAIRAAVAAKVNMTFKILYNAAVAMTGGQEVTGLLDVPSMTRALEAEGVNKIVVCAAEPDRYGANARWAPGVEVHPRDDLPEVQKALRETPGVTVIIYDQRCATEARRLRKRGLLETPPARVAINPAVCEGCGDCVAKSNCTSVQPRFTEFGEKKRIDDLTCNRDYSCLEGDCPSFVTITPKGDAKAPTPTVRPSPPEGDLPAPPTAAVHGQFGSYFTGIGGTGVVTANRTLANAAEAAGFTVIGMDQTGLSQKGGAVVSHLRLAADRDSLGSATIGNAGADLYLSGDIFQAAGPLHLERIKPGKTVAVIESDLTPTAAMLQAGLPPPDQEALRGAVRERAGEGKVAFIASKHIADVAFGDAVVANMVLLGAAFQLGGLPFGLDDIEKIFAGQGKAGAKNRVAFAWGRWAVHDPVAVEAVLAGPAGSAAADPFEPSDAAADAAARMVQHSGLPADLAALASRRAAQIIDYQNATLARRFLDLVGRAAARDSAAKDWALTRSVIAGWHKLLTYKDEYEVARLHAATDYDAVARELGIGGDYELRYHLHPTWLRRMGAKKKVTFGSWFGTVFGTLRHMKGLRGTPLDLFGWDSERRLERAIADDYEAQVGEALSSMDYDRLVELAASPAMVKGYGPVKERNITSWRARTAELMRVNSSVAPAEAGAATI